MVGEILLTAVVLLLSVYAVADIVSRVVFCLFFSSKEQKEYYVLPLEGGAESAEYAVRRFSLLRWFFPFKNVSFVVINRGLDPESEKITALLCQELKLHFYNEKEWTDTLQPTQNEV